jgi:membrane associated rhomboid family serine protease
MAFESSTPRREPIINAPLVVTATAGLLVALHALVSFQGQEAQQDIWVEFAVFPYRFFLAQGVPDAYPDVMSKFLTLVSAALLHANWMHVLVNSAMLLAFGAPTARFMGPGWSGAGRWMLLLVVAIAAGSVLFLLVEGAGGPPMVGASGGTSGLMGAAFLIDRSGRLRSPLSREFLGVALVFALLNALLVFMGPQLLGSGIAWEAHAGGFIGGAAMMLVLAPRQLRFR